MARIARSTSSRVAVGLTATLALWAGAAGCGPRVSASPPDSSGVRAIAGGQFEASGVAHVPGTRSMLFVDDGRTREIFLLELSAEGEQRGNAVAVPLDAEVTDPEGITTDGRFFFIVGSQSKKSGFDGDGLVRFRFDTATRRVAGVERIRGLKAWLAAHVPELLGTEKRTGDDVVNIEAIAWDPRGQRLLLGFRAPVIDGQALVVPIRIADGAAFTSENLRVDGAAMRLSLGGAGIRSLEHDAQANAFRVIVGSAVNDENRDFRVVEWDGVSGSTVRELGTHPREFKPEGITRVDLGGRSVSVIVFDTGHFVVVE